MFNQIIQISKREWQAYFVTSIGLIYLLLFLCLSTALTFFVGDFYQREIADLDPFFQFHPWLYLVLTPALGMRLWSEEYKTGSAELLLTLPVPTLAIVLGKYIAAWLLVTLGLVLSFPMWITVNVLGDPDNGVILGAYFASWLLGGGFLALSACLSATTQNQVVAFIASASLGLVLLLIGLPVVLTSVGGAFPETTIDVMASIGLLKHYSVIARGLIELGDLLYFVGLIGILLATNWLLIELRKVP